MDNLAGWCLLAAAFAVCAFEAAELFFVVADLGGDGFEAAAQLVDLHDQAGQGRAFLARPVLSRKSGIPRWVTA